MIHWQESHTFVLKNKAKHQSWTGSNHGLQKRPSLEEEQTTSVLHALASVRLPPRIIDSITEHGNKASGTLPCVTNGRWFFLELSKETLGMMFMGDAL